ncbi:unnamed protein product [Nezara viridula]|uniref:Uncharacterized protein n=1 Tax=Nezara viridula TaxID=85310 RepID=A0A9P0E511_NEZVI|nr:unnamed protein product [Nezara viridula]
MILCLLEAIGFSSNIPLQLTRLGQLCCKRTFQSSSLIGPQEALISTNYIIGFGPNWRGWHATEHTLTWKASNNLWSEQLSAFLKKCCVLLLMTGHGD